MGNPVGPYGTGAPRRVRGHIDQQNVAIPGLGERGRQTGGNRRNPEPWEQLATATSLGLWVMFLISK